MNASKEEARKAIDVIEAINRRFEQGERLGSEIIEALEKVDTFLHAAERKLPSEAAFKREKAKRK